MTKLKIDFAAGVVEVEGEEVIVREIYQDFKDKVQAWTPASARVVQAVAPTSQQMPSGPSYTPSPTPTAKSGTTHKFSYNIVKTLDLSFRDHDQSLKDFSAEKQPKTALEMNTVFVYYLQKIAGVKGITIDHIYTCYKDVKSKVPGALRQSVIDTSFKKGWIDTKSLDDITITIQGENMVEHDLPRQKS